MDTYIIAYTIYIGVCGLLFFLDDYFNNSDLQDKVILFFLIFVTSLIAAFRPINAPDTQIYARVYDESISIIKSLRIENFSSIFANRQYYSIELGYIFFMSFFRHFCGYRMFLFLNSMLSNWLIIGGLSSLSSYIYQKSDIKYVSNYIGRSGIITIYSMYMMMCGVLYSSVTIRAALSLGLGLCFIAYTLRDEKRLIWSFLLAISSFLVHSTGIVFVLIFILIVISKFEISPVILKGLWVVLTLLYFANIARYTVSGFMQIKDFIFNALGIAAFNSYFTNLEFTIQLREGMIIVLSGVILAIALVKNRLDSVFAILILIGIGLLTFAYPVHAMSRLADFFLIFLIPIAGYYGKIEDYRKFRIVKGLFVLLYIPQYVMIFTRM